MSYKNYKDLKVWQMAVALVRSTYAICSLLPEVEKFGLASQLRRSAISIPSNIAEGQGRGSAAEIKQFSRLALGSLAELDTQLYLVQDIYGLNVKEAEALVEQLNRMLSKMIVMTREEASGYETEILAQRQEPDPGRGTTVSSLQSPV